MNNMALTKEDWEKTRKFSEAAIKDIKMQLEIHWAVLNLCDKNLNDKL